MATKKITAVRKVLKTSSQDSSSLASGNDDSCGNNSGAKRKTKTSGTVVKSRYMQTEKKPVVKKNTQNESVLVPPRPASPKVGSGHKPRFGTPPRRTIRTQSDPSSTSLMPSLLESSSLSGNVFQSTVLDGHCMRPDFDVSVIKENTAPTSLPSSVDLNAKKRNLELETFLLAFLTAKIENNTHKLKAEAERNLILLMEEDEKLRSEVMSKKRQCLHLEKQQQLNDLLDLQIAALKPVAATAKQFAEEYKSFASAIDTTRHELPVKNLHIEEDRGEFLDKAVVCLNQSQSILEQYMKDVSTDSESTAARLKEIKHAAHEIDQHLFSTSADLLELSSLVSQETVLVRQSLEEEKIGLNTVQKMLIHPPYQLMAVMHQFAVLQPPINPKEEENVCCPLSGAVDTSDLVETKITPSSMHRKPRCERKRGQEQCGAESKPEVSVPRGTCATMCPISEIRRRETQRQLHCFEMERGTEKQRMPRADLSRTVKEYSRPAAGKDSTRACDLRPPDLLFKTVCYLVDEIAASTTLQPWTEVYNFVFDRLRSVRQDMIIQRVSGWECVAVLERTVRFHLYASYRLCGEPLRLYDPHINDTHLQECLSWLLECYSEGQYEHQAEFQALSLLYNLGSTRTLQHTLELPERVRLSPAVQLALAVNRAYIESNPVRLLRLARKLDFIQACALHRHLLSCRRNVLLLYSHGHNSRNCRFPIQKLADILSLECALAGQLCQAHGIQVSGDCVVFSKASFRESPCKELLCAQMHQLVDDKQQDLSVSRIIQGIA